MDPITIVEKAYKLIYLVDVPEAIPEAEIIIADDWKKYVREIIYEIAFMVYKGKAYRTVRDVLILNSLKLLYKLDKEEPEKEILKEFIKLVHMYVSHSLRTRLDLVYNKEKWNTIYNALKEFDNLIQRWDLS
jgi:hypothetical protein